MRTSGEILICNHIDALREGFGMKSVGLFTPREESLRSGAGQNELAADRALAIFVAELFATLHRNAHGDSDIAISSACNARNCINQGISP